MSAALALVVVAALAFRGAHRARDATLFYSAGTVACLAVVMGASLVSEVFGTVNRAAGIVTVIAFYGAGLGVLMVRHSVVPLSPRALPIAVGASAAYVVTALATGLSLTGEPEGASDLIAYGVGLAIWTACIGEPLVRFWRIARTRPLVQRARLRSFTLVIGGIIVLIALELALPRDATPVIILGSASYVTLTLLLYASFAPPAWMRRLWRHREEGALITEAPLFYASERRELARRSLEWAVRLVGADGGWIVDADGRVLAAHGTDIARAARLAAETARSAEPVIVTIRDDRRRQVAALPLSLENGVGQLAVFAGPFTPPFGEDELRLLAHYAAASSTSLDHLRLAELKDAFLSAVSHELRTPITNLQGIALTLGREDADSLPQESRKDLRLRLERNAMKLERLLADLLDLERLNTGELVVERRPTDVQRCLRDAIVRTDAIRTRHVELTPLGPVIANVDPGQVVRIFEALLANVARHTPADAQVWIELRNGADDIHIVVSDDGPGVPPEAQAVVFEAFHRSSIAHAPGTGVGLTIVARFAQLHGGSAWVEDRPGGGASFHVRLMQRISRSGAA